MAKEPKKPLLKKGEVLGPSYQDLTVLVLVLRDVADEKIYWGQPMKPTLRGIEVDYQQKIWRVKDGDFKHFSGLHALLMSNKKPIPSEKHMRKAIKILFGYERRQ